MSSTFQPSAPESAGLHALLYRRSWPLLAGTALLVWGLQLALLHLDRTGPSRYAAWQLGVVLLTAVLAAVLWERHRSASAAHQLGLEQQRVAHDLIAGEPLSPGQSPEYLRPLLSLLSPAFTDLRIETERTARQARRLEQILDSLDVAVIAIGRDRRALYANLAAARVFRLATPPQPGERLEPLARLPQLSGWFEEVLRTQHSVSERIGLVDERVLQAELSPLSDGQGLVLLARDVTGTVNLETTRRDFIAAVSHELRTPLTSIRGYAEILLQDESDPQRAQFLGTIMENARRLGKLAQDLVTLSSIETGTYPFHFQPLAVGSLVEGAQRVLQPLAEERGASLIRGVIEPAELRADPDALHRVLLNLMENALVHGGEHVAVTVSGTRHGGEYCLRVQDTGVGITVADQSRIFERFYRVDKSHSRAGGGSGLGLALVKHIVREHGGRIEVQSKLGTGSTFQVWLPLAELPPALAGDSGPANT